MFGKKHHRRSQNPIFILFRFMLSLIMFAILLGGAYSAYKHFSGLDPLKLDPQSIVRDVLKINTPDQVLTILSSIKLSPKILDQTTKVVNEQALSFGDKIPTSTSPVNFKFLLIADSHNDNLNLAKAIAQAKNLSPDLAFIIGLGDYTDVGTIQELEAAKIELDKAGLRYFLIAGDHDLWDARNKNLNPDANFKEVFGPLFQTFEYNNFKFMLLDNSDNYEGISESQQKWINDEFEKVKNKSLRGIFVFIHEPIYHPSSDHYMGKVDKNLKVQVEWLSYQLKAAGVKEVFSGDIHYFSQYEEPVTKILMTTVGALTYERNPQSPRYAVVSVYDDGSSKVEDIEIK